MLADQFLEAITSARTIAALDELARKLRRAHGEGCILDADAQARRAVLTGEGPLPATLGPPAGRRPAKRREKMFGPGRPRALDRNAKVRIMHWARCLSRRTEPGKAYGEVTAKALAVLEALLWAFHNAKSGQAIAEAAGCCRDTVCEAIKALEAAGILSWVHRIKRVREPCADLLGVGGSRSRVVRTSNAYAFNDPGAADRPETRGFSSKSENPTGTPNQEFSTDKRGAFESARRRFRPPDGPFQTFQPARS